MKRTNDACVVSLQSESAYNQLNNYAEYVRAVRAL